MFIFRRIAECFVDGFSWRTALGFGAIGYLQYYDPNYVLFPITAFIVFLGTCVEGIEPRW